MHNGRSHRSYVQVCIFFIIAFLLVETFEASLYDYPTAELSTSWVNGPDINHTIDYSDGPIIKALLLNQNSDYLRSFAFGFYCHKSNNNCRSFLLAIFIVSTNSGAGIINAGRPQKKLPVTDQALGVQGNPFDFLHQLSFGAPSPFHYVALLPHSFWWPLTHKMLSLCTLSSLFHDVPSFVSVF
ncbi:hypothetical protein ZOSMA_335G00050 [Zostera marina]|uniref:Uncharacterized protein n=1 Tax=Zostera marina TaxID=29655 RepID=A0A0K9PAF7_ZOSMR|nr:hypothetical protein ZOSMA_335G00050 [Zostera marina]